MIFNCKYCKIKNRDEIDYWSEDYIIPNDYDYALFLIGNELHFDNSDDEYATGVAKINFCPMCGRQLNKDYVAMR